MAFNWQLRVPFGYHSQYVTLEWLNDWLLEHHHPEYVRRLIGWLHYKNGTTGVGGGWRPGGAQPDLPGFAPEGRSFHQDQKYADGFVGACAVDSVFMDGPDAGTAHDGIAWSEVPQQGSSEAARWGIHANVGVPGNGESWHLQPVEIDGWGSATGNGTHAAPAIVAGYPIPAEHDPAHITDGDNDMEIIDPFTWIKNHHLDPAGGDDPIEAPGVYEFDAPFGVVAFGGNFTVVGATETGWVTAWGDGPTPDVSTVRIIPTTGNDNYATVKAGTDGKIRVRATRSCRLYVDVQAVQR